ncbi:MAG: hypothetical protein Q9217_001701 [Psora testacea]
MSGLRGAAKNAVSFMTKPQSIEEVAKNFTHPTAGPGKPTWPTSQRELKNVGFHFDLSDVTKTIPDTRPGAAKGATRQANVFKWQAASEAERKSIKDWIKTHGSHAEAATLIVPEDASHEEFTEILNDIAGKI